MKQRSNRRCKGNLTPSQTTSKKENESQGSFVRRVAKRAVHLLTKYYTNQRYKAEGAGIWLATLIRLFFFRLGEAPTIAPRFLQINHHDILNAINTKGPGRAFAREMVNKWRKNGVIQSSYYSMVSRCTALVRPFEGRILTEEGEVDLFCFGRFQPDQRRGVPGEAWADNIYTLTDGSKGLLREALGDLAALANILDGPRPYTPPPPIRERDRYKEEPPALEANIKAQEEASGAKIPPYPSEASPAPSEAPPAPSEALTPSPAPCVTPGDNSKIFTQPTMKNHSLPDSPNGESKLSKPPYSPPKVENIEEAPGQPSAAQKIEGEPAGALLAPPSPATGAIQQTREAPPPAGSIPPRNAPRAEKDGPQNRRSAPAKNGPPPPPRPRQKSSQEGAKQAQQETQQPPRGRGEAPQNLSHLEAYLTLWAETMKGHIENREAQKQHRQRIWEVLPQERE